MNIPPLEFKILEAFLVYDDSHRKIQMEILKIDTPLHGGGYKTMNILHKYNIRKEDKGVLNKDATSEEIMNYIISKNNQYSKAEKNELTNQYIRQYLSRMNIEYEEKEKSFFEIKISDAIYALKSRTYNGHYVFVEKSEIPDLSQNIMIDLVEWSNC
jgi:hypothetical protein